MTRCQRMSDHQKRGTFTFKTLFDSSRYDFRFPRYRRAKGKVIFLIVCHPCRSLVAGSRSLSLGLSQTPDEWQTTRFLEKRSSTHFPGIICRPVGRELIHNLRVASNIIIYGFFEPPLAPYISAIDRDKTKSGSNDTVSSIFPRVGFKDAIFTFSSREISKVSSLEFHFEANVYESWCTTSFTYSCS